MEQQRKISRKSRAHTIQKGFYIWKALRQVDQSDCMQVLNHETIHRLWFEATVIMTLDVARSMIIAWTATWSSQWHYRGIVFGIISCARAEVADMTLPSKEILFVVLCAIGDLVNASDVMLIQGHQLWMDGALRIVELNDQLIRIDKGYVTGWMLSYRRRWRLTVAERATRDKRSSSFIGSAIFLRFLDRDFSEQKRYQSTSVGQWWNKWVYSSTTEWFETRWCS